MQQHERNSPRYVQASHADRKYDYLPKFASIRVDNTDEKLGVLLQRKSTFQKLKRRQRHLFLPSVKVSNMHSR